MEDKTIISFLFTFHFILFLVKIWAMSFLISLFIFTKGNMNRVMIVFRYSTMALLVFNVMMMLMEGWYLLSFFKDIDLYYYEYASIFDQILFTYIGITYFIKEGKNG